MSNSKKLEEDAAKHRGFEKAISDGVHPIFASHYSRKVRSEAGPAEKELMEIIQKAIAENLKNIMGIHDIYADIDLITKLDRPVDFINVNITLDNCSHTNKRKEGIHKLFWVCNDCKKDLGDV